MGENEKKEKKLLFAETSVSTNAQNYTPKTSKYSADRIIEFLENPSKNAQLLQEVSLWLYYNSGIYNRLVNNYAGMNRYDMYLYPIISSRFASKKKNEKNKADKLIKEYLNVANYLEKYSYKSNYRNVGTNLIIQGEVYLFRVEDNEGIIEKQIPSEICKISKVINDGLYKYSININKLSDKDYYSMMPIQLQNLYDDHKKGILDKKLYVDSTYVLVQDKEAICLSLNNNISTKSIPLMSYLFPSLVRLMDEETDEIVENKANNLKLVHQKYEIDDEGESKIAEIDLKKMHNSAKSNLPYGVCINTNPLDVTVHTLQRTGSVNATNRQTLTELVYNNAGVNSEIFNGNNSNNQAIITGTNADEIYCDTLNDAFENYTKYMIKQKSKNPLWMPRLVRNTKYNEQKIFEEALKCGTVGLSRLKLMACQHYSPLEAITLLDFETDSGIDELFIPLATSYTQSSNDNEEGGRPKNKDSKTEKDVGDNKDSTN